jgi:hypothetical protein
VYANHFEVGFSALEFLLDFGQYSPDAGTTLVHTRVVTSPVYAKELLTLLRASIERFETEHGPIEIGGEAP